MRNEKTSPVGTAETLEITAIQPSLRDCDCNVDFPTDESVGYFQTSLPGLSLCFDTASYARGFMLVLATRVVNWESYR